MCLLCLLSKNFLIYDDRLPIVHVPEIDDLVIPEIDASKLPGGFKSILSYVRQSGKTEKSVKMESDG